MVTICVDGENKTHKITDWTLWAGNDDREVMLTCHFRSGRKYTRPLSVCQITPTVNLRNVFLERKGNAVTSGLNWLLYMVINMLLFITARVNDPTS